MDATNLKTWLPFDESATLDRCGNSWTATGDVSLSTDVKLFGAASVHLPNGAYLTANNVIDINADKWTFDAWAYLVSSSGDNGYFALSARTDAARYGIINGNDGIWVAATDKGWQAKNTSLTFPSVQNQWIHLAIVKNGTTVTFYQGGVTVWTFETSALDNSGAFILGGNYYGYNTDIYFDEVRFYEGVALWTSNFTPPTSADYAELSLSLGYPATLTKTFDVERKLSNVVEFTADVERTVIAAWRYFNAGTADTLTVTGTTLTDLPVDKSVTGTAFYQTARAKCFDLPSTPEVWLKFDVYFNGSNRWRAYNGGNNGATGITAQQTDSDKIISVFSNSQNVQQTYGFSIPNQLQTVLLHMVCGSSAGVVEAWVDGTKIHTYTGDVNHGEDFADIYLQSDGAGTFFSNVIISNKRLTQADGYQKFTADVERRVKSVFNIEFTADVARLLNPEILADVFSRNLVAWLPFDKTPTFDVKLNTWTAHGDLTVSETGAISGKALQFNGRGFVVMSEPVKFFGRQRFTIACWFSGTEAATADGTLWWMDNLAYSYTRGNIYLGFDDTGRLWLQIYNEGDSREYTVTTSTSFLDGNKHFAKVVFDGFLFYLFVDGDLIGKTEYIVFNLERQYQLYVGDTSVTSPRYGFKMTLDEFTFWVEGELYERFTTPPTSADYDFYKSIPIKNSIFFDVERRIIGRIKVAFSADVAIFDTFPIEFTADVVICGVISANFTTDVEILDVFIIEFTADVNRAIKAKLKMFAIDSSEYFSGGLSSSADIADDEAAALTPVVIPPQETIPAAPDNTIGLQSIEISLSEQQLTDNVSFVGVVPFDIMFPVQGQYLDYVFDMRVERVQQKGVLYTCDCCVDVDQLLYTQIAYTVPKSTDWHSAGESTATTTVDDKSVSASYHASSIARTIGKTPVIQFDDFASTVLTENLGGATYADMIRDVFGWSSRVPTHMINVFIRNDKIYFVQRGHEAHLLDLTGTKHTIPIVTHELVRMTWGSTPWSQTTNLESKKYMPSTSKGSSTGGTSGGSSGNPTGGSTGGGSGDDPTGGTSGGSTGGNAEIADIEKNGGQVMVASDSWNGYPESGHVTYTYNRDGLLIQTYTYVYNQETNQSTHTTVDHAYDADGTVIYTKTFVQSMTGIGTDGDSSSQTEEYKGYIILPNGEKFLARESTIRRVGENTLTPTELVEAKTIIHTPTRAGQGHTTVISDGEDIGGVVGQNTGDDRVTPFARYKAGSLIDSSRTTDASGSYDALNDIDSSGAYQYNPETGKWEKVSNDTDLLPQTLNGLSLYDSSFPIHNVGKLVELTNAIKWLNRRTKETVTMTIYEYPHLIDFNDRILFNGAQYFLVSNVAMTNARVFNEQRVTFTRWY